MKPNKRPGRQSNPLLEPVLSSEEVLYCFNRGLSSVSLSGTVNRQSAQSRSGTHTSFFRGSGLDYDDSRAYQPGDELRNINWRLMARSSHLYTKVFQEERESSVMLIIDRRAPMRFGTRERLKVTRAVEIACYLAGLSLARGYSVGVTLLQPEIRRLPSQRAQSRIRDCLASAASACPPLNAVSDEVKLSAILSHLRYSATAGSRLILVSDFHDLEESDRTVLAQLAARYQLQAIQVLDPVEETLPGGVWLIDGYTDTKPVKINANDANLHHNYHIAVQEKQALIVSLFEQNRIPMSKLYTNESFDDVAERLMHG